MPSYVIGLDYGTNSCRALLVNAETGAEIASSVFNYPTGEQGIVGAANDPNVARQNPQDYLDGLESMVRGALSLAKEAIPSFQASDVAGIGVDTTGSTPIPVDRSCTPLCFSPAFKDDINAYAWLWKDHSSYAEAETITRLGVKMRPQYLAKCGGTYSSEWFWAKLLHLKAVAPKVFHAAYSFVECCDWIPAVLTGSDNPLTIKRSVCAAGHKALYNVKWGGLPDKEFLAALDPALAELRDRLYGEAYTADTRAGGLCAEWARRLGLKPGIAVSVGALDAHEGAVGMGCSIGTFAKIMGTSGCDMMLAPNHAPLADIPGVCGIVDGSIAPGYFGIEAGQSAVGDLFLWFVNHLVPDTYGKTRGEKFIALGKEADRLRPGESGLLALDWNNGNRCILTDARLSGLLLGQNLRTTAGEIYRALIEATAFGAKIIVDRVREYGVPVNGVIACGGLATKNAMLTQIYADVLNLPFKISSSDQTCALGAALFGAMAAGVYKSLPEAQAKFCHYRGKVFHPIPENAAVYAKLSALYRQLHDAFGTQAQSSLGHVMKELLAIRQEARR